MKFFLSLLLLVLPIFAKTNEEIKKEDLKVSQKIHRLAERVAQAEVSRQKDIDAFNKLFQTWRDGCVALGGNPNVDGFLNLECSFPVKNSSQVKDSGKK